MSTASLHSRLSLCRPLQPLLPVLDVRVKQTDPGVVEVPAVKLAVRTPASGMGLRKRYINFERWHKG